MNKLMLNNEVYKATEQDLPCLIVYGDKSGGSHFTVAFVADMFSSGSKILFFTAFPMAKDNFLEQVGGGNSKIAFVNSTKDLEVYKDSEVIILNSGDEDLFTKAIELLPDINERVVLVKNIEAFSPVVFNACINLNKIILSGHIDNCTSKEKIMDKNYKSIVVFTKPEIALPIEVPELEKYTGYLSSESQSGIVKVNMN